MNTEVIESGRTATVSAVNIKMPKIIGQKNQLTRTRTAFGTSFN
jgi:hypothetical protein